MGSDSNPLIDRAPGSFTQPQTISQISGTPASTTSPTFVKSHAFGDTVNSTSSSDFFGTSTKASEDTTPHSASSHQTAAQTVAAAQTTKSGSSTTPASSTDPAAPPDPSSFDDEFEIPAFLRQK